MGSEFFQKDVPGVVEVIIMPVVLPLKRQKKAKGGTGRTGIILGRMLLRRFRIYLRVFQKVDILNYI